MSLRLHNTKGPLGALRVVEQDREWMKPRGLWYGVGEAWLEWCRSEMPSWVHGHTYEIILRRAAKVLKLQTAKAVCAFHDEYAPKSRWGWPDWARLAKRYDGIEIAPYQWSLRLGWQTWYYGWDCASGCIWNPRAIASVREVAGRVSGTQEGTPKPQGGTHGLTTAIYCHKCGERVGLLKLVAEVARGRPEGPSAPGKETV